MSSQSKSQSWSRLALGILLLTSGVLVGCDEGLVCAEGEVRYEGRPPRRLFAYDTTCRSDCFSYPEKSSCKPSCPDVSLAGPEGALVNERELQLIDVENLGSDKALAFVFSFVDEAGGTAPDGWGFAAAGPRTYLSDEVEGTARFDIRVGVSPIGVSTSLPTDWLMLDDELPASPGRLEVLSTEGDRIEGRFFLGFATETNQAQGQVIGCFNLGIGSPVEEGETRARPLTQ